MFVAMGLSAVIPVIHGLEMYGVNQMSERIGLWWLILEGFLYILGAGLYAVSYVLCTWSRGADFERLAGPNDPGRVRLTFGEAHVRACFRVEIFRVDPTPGAIQGLFSF